jgi:DNA polymerase-3 subunit alpha (Gram-positive type)
LTKATVTVKEENLLEILKIALEAIARGVVFKMIDIYKSHGSHFLINKEENSLLAPFGCIDGLGAAAADSIIEARRESKFSDLDDFKNRTKVNKKHISEFVNLGVIDNLDVSSQISLSNFFD